MKYLLLISAVLLSGCAHKERVPSIYEGSHIKYSSENTHSDVVMELGVPDNTQKLSDKLTAYQWTSNNGATTTGSSVGVSDSVGYAVNDCIGCGFEGDSSTVSKTSSSSNVSTHICGLLVVADNETDRIVKTKFTGTEDEKCYQHFDSIIVKNPNTVRARNEALAHNNKIGTRRKVMAVLGVVGGAAALSK